MRPNTIRKAKVKATRMPIVLRCYLEQDILLRFFSENRALTVDSAGVGPYVPRSSADEVSGITFIYAEERAMKIRNSLKSAKLREKGCRIVRRRGRVYVINKRNPRFKARQG